MCKDSNSLLKTFKLQEQFCHQQNNNPWISINFNCITENKMAPYFYFYPPQTEFAKVMLLHISVCPQEGVPGQVHPPVGSPTPGTPPGRYAPQQVHTPPRQVHPLGRYIPQAGTPPWSSAWWEIQATSGRYASFWNAFLS